MKSSGKISLGLDVGGTKIKALALGLPDQILKTFDMPSDAGIGPEAVRNAIRLCVKEFTDAGIAFHSLGLGCAGSVDPDTGVVRNSPNFSHWNNIPLRDWVESDTGCRAHVHNDANCAAFSEWKLGNAQGCKNMVLLTFGTGVGGGVVLNQQLFTGSTGSAGELGHFSIHSDGIACACGNRGCFERYCSGSALQKDFVGLSTKEIFERAHEERFKSRMDTFIADVKTGLVSIANVFDPDFILLGGGIASGLSHYLEEISSFVREHAFPSVGQRVEIRMTRFGKQSGALGAALLALEP